MINDGPFKQNMKIGDQVDLTELPIPWWNEKDGGRYIGTWHLNITKDPETGQRNVGVYRMQLLGPRQTSINYSENSDIALHIAKAEARKDPLRWL